MRTDDETRGHNVTRSPTAVLHHNLRCSSARIFVAFLTMSAIAISNRLCHADERTNPRQSPLVTEQRLTEALQRRRGTVVTGMSLRRIVTEIQHSTGITTLIDRRVDPTSPIDLKTDYTTIRKTIEALASRRSARASFGRQLVVIAPPEASARLRTLMEINGEAVRNQRAKLGRSRYAAITEARDYSWDRLAQPRQILQQAASASDVRVANIEKLPHDLWAEATLPPLSFTDLATLILNQFDLTMQISADGLVTLTEIPAEVSIERRHRIPLRDKETVMQRWMKEFPELKIEWKSSSAFVTATAEVHDRLTELVRGEAMATEQAAGLSARQFTMTVPAGTTYGTLIASLRAQVPIRMEQISDERLADMLKKRVQFEAKNKPAAEFFDMAFSGLPVDVEVTDKEVVLKFRDE